MNKFINLSLRLNIQITFNICLMISIPESYYNHLLSIVESLHRNFNFLLNEKEKFLFDKLEDDFIQLNQTMRKSITQMQHNQTKSNAILIQYQDQNAILKQKTQKSIAQLTRKEQEISKMRGQLAKTQKQVVRLKQVSKSLKQQVSTKMKTLQQTQQFYKSQLKQIKKDYKQESKSSKSRIKELQLLLKQAMLSSNDNIESELDKELEELKKYQNQNYQQNQPN